MHQQFRCLQFTILSLLDLGCITPTRESIVGDAASLEVRAPIAAGLDARLTGPVDSRGMDRPADTNVRDSDRPGDANFRPGDSGLVRDQGGAEPPEPRGPMPPTPGVNFPFPQNRASSRCELPTGYRNSDVQKAYAKWRNDTVTSEGAKGFLRVKRLASDPGLEVGSTVSEGIAYGMMIAVYMNDQNLFDNLWKYEQQFLNGNGLMDWYISASGDRRLGMGAATDADEDMAFALLMADKQWGGQGTLSEGYLAIAKKQIQRVWDHEIFESKMLRVGDGWGADWNTVNISYFSPAYYRIFGQVMNKAADWDAVVKTSYDILEKSLNAKNGNQSNGLVPAWCTAEGEPRAAFDGAPTHYQYDSCRTPFRIALDYCWFGEPRALSYITKTTAFFAGIGATKIQDGYDLNGNPRPTSLISSYQQSASFVGPAGVGAMGLPEYKPFLNDSYANLATLNLFKGGEYYDESWMVLSLLMMTGNFLNYYQ